MYQTEYRKLKELQFLQATNFLLLTKLIPNIKGDKNFVFNLPVINDQNKNTSEVKFKLKKMSDYTSNLERLQWNTFTKDFLNLCVEEGQSI